MELAEASSPWLATGSNCWFSTFQLFIFPQQITRCYRPATNSKSPTYYHHPWRHTLSNICEDHKMWLILCGLMEREHVINMWKVLEVNIGWSEDGCGWSLDPSGEYTVRSLKSQLEMVWFDDKGINFSWNNWIPAKVNDARLSHNLNFNLFI
ncbi:hypothetical protein HanXRQr2_Chr05g0217021 [Helianthus annuus]|uniref:Uncharacterized protein n=1 Tax=Helianthus annuus TaxID=4232 RepID=A0A251UQ10_HELAN|nr:hypothetical protein HanXRQr2_Chr05g0217021 [Helianthus annuus]KAJ0922929.1 hypothetical protein HanPSC8_Chr05g0209651 [Helianthus annuus]